MPEFVKVNAMNFDFDKMMVKDVYLEGRGSRTVECIKCHKSGSLTIKPTKSKGKTYRCYYSVEHRDGKKRTWCYLGKFETLPIEYKNILGPKPEP
jgi:hypothetical protein